MNPYAELGVPPDANISAVKRAYRRRARETHPDTGGNASAFTRCKQAAVVLLDPKKRAQFDQTGVIEEDAPDNRLSEILVAVSQLLDAAIMGCEQMQEEPSRIALLDRMRGLAEQSIRGMGDNRKRIERHLKISERLVDRFKPKRKDGGNRLASLLEQRIAAQRANIAKMLHEEAKLRDTITFLRDYDFEADRPSAAPERRQLGQWNLGTMFS